LALTQTAKEKESKHELQMLLIDNRPLIEYETHWRLPCAVH